MKASLILASAISAALLSACGTLFPYTSEQLAAKAKEDSTPNLCAITLMNPSMAVLNAAENEIQERGATCDWEQARAIAEAQYARQQAQAQQSMMMMGMGAALLQQSGPHYYAPPPVQTSCIRQGIYMNCTSY